MSGRVKAGSAAPVLRKLAFIADGERGALVGPDGNICWLCFPRWHDDAVLSSLIGGPGSYAVTPTTRYTSGGSYEGRSLVWHSRWIAEGAIVECEEAMVTPSSMFRTILLRRVRGVRGETEMKVVLDLGSGFGRSAMSDIGQSEGGTWDFRVGGIWGRWTGAASATVVDGHLEMSLPLAAGQSHDLVLQLATENHFSEVPVAELWTTTREYWNNAIPSFDATIAPRDSQLAAAVLHGLTSASGGMVAAATMSLPEHADRSRNYDYRYAWIRDQCFAGVAAAEAGWEQPLDAAVRFIGDRVLAEELTIRPAYRVDGGPIPDERQIDLPGYPGGTDIVGNHAREQFQLDSLGDILRLLSAAARMERLDERGRAAADRVVTWIQQSWVEPDSGVWELDARWWTQSRLECVAGLRQWAEAGAMQGRSTAADITALADQILTEVSTRCVSPAGHWQRAQNDPRCDASLIWPAVFGALPADDPRTRRTLNKVLGDLADDFYLYRYAIDNRPLGESEGAFLLCGFIASLALHQQGYEAEALRWFERNRSACGSPGVFTEEFDVRQRQLRGNLPQAFVHAGLLHASAWLAGPMMALTSVGDSRYRWWLRFPRRFSGKDSPHRKEPTMPQKSWSKKRERQYQHIKESLESRGRGEQTAEEIAARTVNKERARSGESETASRSSIDDVSSGRRGGKRSHRGAGGRTKAQLYNEAKKMGIKGRSKMTKKELQEAIGGR